MPYYQRKNMQQPFPTNPHETVKPLTLALNWLINSGLFYLGWILTIRFVLNDMLWQGPLLNLAIILLHIARSPRRIFESTLVFTLPLIGLAFDSTLTLLGILRFEGPYSCCSWLPPLWVSSLWALFATSINHSLSWAGSNTLLAILVGGIGGAFSYLAAIKVGAAHFLINDYLGIAFLVAAWGTIFPVCFAYNRWLKRKFDPSA